MARDPNRIYKFCNQLANLWVTYCPDWRFCQLVNNVFYRDGGNGYFYAEEDNAIKMIEDYISKHGMTPSEDSLVTITKKDYEELLRYRKIYEDFHKTE